MVWWEYMRGEKIWRSRKHQVQGEIITFYICVWFFSETEPEVFANFVKESRLLKFNLEVDKNLEIAAVDLALWKSASKILLPHFWTRFASCPKICQM